MTAQSVILPLPSDHARFIVLRLKDLSIEDFKERLEQLFTTRDRLITQHPNAQLKRLSLLVLKSGQNCMNRHLLVLNN